MSDKLQILVAAMHQSDFSLVEQMNIPCSAIIANQADCDSDAVVDTGSGVVRMITTSTRGVGVNRNIALEAADHELILFADEDVRYFDGIDKQIEKAFSEYPKADVIIFGMKYSKNGVITGEKIPGRGRLHLWNSLRYGSYAIACRSQSVISAGIKFSTEFGGGTIYGSGEDSLFIKSCYDAGLCFYGYDYALGVCAKDSSSWFTGCNEKYFFDRGALFGKMFPVIKPIIVLYYSIRVKKPTEIPLRKRYELMRAGMIAGKDNITYDEYERRKNKTKETYHSK